MPVSAEYSEFLHQEQTKKKLNWYEKFCALSEKVLPISPWQSLSEKYESAIKFSHMKVAARSAFSATLLATVLAFFTTFMLLFVSSGFSDSVGNVALAGIFSVLTFYYFYSYPTHHAIVFRIKASSEMILAVVYMTISMRVSANLENAVEFAAKNLYGPLAYDLRQLLWTVYTRQYSSLSDAFDVFINKWKSESEEFTQALTLLRDASAESPVRLEKVLDEAVFVILGGTKDRMKKYAQELRTPVTGLNAIGILLPIIGLVFFPIMALFLPGVVQPVFLAIGYDILLPVVVYWMMTIYLEKRPYTFHQPLLEEHVSLRQKILSKNFLISVALAVTISSVGLYKIFTITEAFSFDLLLYSLLITVGITSGISAYTILESVRKLKMRDEIVQIENEFAEVLFQIGNQVRRGTPLESSIKTILPRISELKISKFFEAVVSNIETFGMTFEQAIFDKQRGAVKFYSSRLLSAVSHAIVEISGRGMESVSKAMLSISTYLKDVKSVEDDLRDMLSEVTSTMEIQSRLLAPLSAGVVVALTAIMFQLLLVLKDAITKIEEQVVTSSGALGSISGTIFGNLITINNMIPLQYFQLIVGIYTIEVVGMLAVFQSVINNGEENILRKYNLGKLLIWGTAIYALVAIFIYMGFTSLVPISGLVLT